MYYGDKTKKAAEVYVKTITPAQAELLISHNYEKQRHIKPNKVRQFVDLIKSGQWDPYCGDLVRVDRAGNVIDGQHRLQACIEADMPIEVLYSEGFDTEDFNLVDAGTARSGSDVLGGIKNSNVVAALCKFVINYESMGLCYAMFRNTPPNAMIAQRFEPWMTSYAHAGDVIRRKLGGGSAASVAFVKWITDGIDPVKSADFWAQIVDDYCLNKTFAAVKRCVMQRSGRGKKFTPQDTAIMLIKAWNAFYQDREISRIVIDGSNYDICGLS